MTVETLRPKVRARREAAILSVRLLGEIRLQRNGQFVALPASKRTRALLGYLVATGIPQSRQTLCDLLWDGPDDPRAALRWSLTKLRPLIDEADRERLEADRERVAFRPAQALVDVRRLDKLLGQQQPAALPLGQLEEAAELLGGEFLDGLDLPSCYRFHHWCLGERERWGSLRRRVLADLVARLTDDPLRALPYARAMVATDPLSEAAHGRLVELLGLVGRRKDAQDHYLYARDMLRREMDAPLSGDLKAPASARRAPPTESTPKPASVVSLPLDRGLVGRIREQEIISGALEAIVSGSTPPGLVFLGEPGIGKSRLLSVVAQGGERRGARIIAARCFEAEAVRPYGCWADALRPIVDGITDPATRRDLALFTTSREAPTGDDGGRSRLFGAVQGLLQDLARAGPLVLLIDDLQWIDEGSSSLLHYLLRAADELGAILFAGAARTGEIDDNPWCKKLISALAGEGRINRLTLAPLDVSEAAQMLGGAPDSSEIAAAVRESGGNPLFLVELARAGLNSQRPAGQSLASLIGDRLSRLDAATADLIVFASAMTRAFRPELLGAAMEVPEPQLVERLARLERRGLLRPETDGRFDFAHDLIRQITYRGLSQPRRRLIHRQIARALEAAVKNDQELAGELAYHAGAAGDHQLAVNACIAAGEHCLRVFANAGALDAADRGLGHLAYCSAGPGRAHRQIALLSVKVFAGASPGARAMPRMLGELHRAVEEAELMGLRDDAAHGWHLISWTTQQSNDTDSSHRAILRAEFLSRTTDPLTRCQHLSNAGRCMLEGEADNVVRARSFLADAEQLAGELKQTFVEIEWGKALLARWDGDLAEASSLMRRALTLSRLREDRWREMECLVWIVKIAIERGAYDEVAALCDEIDSVAKRIGESRAPVADALRAIVAFAVAPSQGPMLKQSLAALRNHDDKAQLAYVLNNLGSFELDRGRPDAALEAANEALGAAQAVKLGTEIVVALSILIQSQVLLGHVSEASALLAQPIRGAGPAPFSARARENLARAKALLGDSNAGSNGDVTETAGLRAGT
jgi:DNA-binding SARP family transcriptional activator/tetratricopeptide (TPR) repeat protein